MIKDTYNKDIKIQNLLKENEDLKAKLNMHKSDESRSTNTANRREKANKQSENNCTTQEIAKLIEEKLNNGLNLIQENVNLLIKTKLNEITASTTLSNESQVSYAAILGKMETEKLPPKTSKQKC